MALQGRLGDAIAQIRALFPDSAASDIEKPLRAVLERMLSDLGMVSRQEFEAQQAVLQRTRERVEQLEQQLVELQKQLG